MNILHELYKFKTDLIFLGPEIKDDRLAQFENKIGFVLPADFKSILQRHNGISLFGTEILGLDISFKETSIDKVYDFEHNICSNKMFRCLIPFSPDGMGNHYCLKLVGNNHEVIKVVFWQHDIIYDNVEDVEVCNNNFTEWIEEVMLGWTLEVYNYDGTEK